jgi:hypothetical protein
LFVVAEEDEGDHESEDAEWGVEVIGLLFLQALELRIDLWTRLNLYLFFLILFLSILVLSVQQTFIQIVFLFLYLVFIMLFLLPLSIFLCAVTQQTGIQLSSQLLISVLIFFSE